MKKTVLFLAISLIPMIKMSSMTFDNESMIISHITSVSAITEVYGDGQKITAAAVEYDKDIADAKLSKSVFTIEGRTITKVYANKEASKASHGCDGKYVIIEMSTSDNGASIFAQNGPKSAIVEAKVYVTQTGDIMTTEGKTYTSTTDIITNSKVINLIVDDFKQFEFMDPATGLILNYNLFIPEKYDRKNKYPMVLFMPDASITGAETKTTLIQGLGAVIWASPAEQAKHECFVLAPVYPSQTVNDKSEASEYLDVTVNLVKAITSKYSIDISRLYTTGQSGGCMMSIAINIKYPDIFAASFLVAGQWDASLVAPLAKDKIWIIVSEGDNRAFPGMNAIMAALEKEGAKISRATWDARSDAAGFTKEVTKMTSEETNIKYTTFEKGTTLPGDKSQAGRNEHMQTWNVAYSIEGVRDWIFAQKK